MLIPLDFDLGTEELPHDMPEWCLAAEERAERSSRERSLKRGIPDFAESILWIAFRVLEAVVAGSPISELGSLLVTQCGGATVEVAATS